VSDYTESAARVRAYLDAIDAHDQKAVLRYHPEIIHGFNDLELLRSDLRNLLKGSDAS
jgi:hypothetical protein